MDINEKPKFMPLFGAAIFVLTILALLLIGFPLQMKLGMTGLIITELLLLVISALSVIILKLDPKGVFPIKKIRLRPLFASLFLYISIYPAVLLSGLVITYFFPQITEIGYAMTQFLHSVPFWATLIISALMPGICEEALFRGVILSTYKNNIRRRWLVILISAILFGLFHLDPTRFLSTAILGGVFTYILLKTDNILLSVIFHFINNFVSLAAGSALPTDFDATAIYDKPSMLLSIGSFLILGSIAPVFFTVALNLFEEKGREIDKAKSLRKWLLSAAVMALVFILGIVICVVAINSGALDLQQ